MAINPHRKGGVDVPVTDGGTGASDAGSALTNLGALDETAHDLLDHTGLPGVGSSSPQIIHQSNPNFVLANASTPFVYTLPANTLTTDGDQAVFSWWVSNVQGHGLSNTTFVFGGVTFWLGTFSNPAVSQGAYSGVLRVIRVSGNQAYLFAEEYELESSFPTPGDPQPRRTHRSTPVTVGAFSGAINLSLTQSDSTTNIVVRSFQAVRYPAIP